MGLQHWQNHDHRQKLLVRGYGVNSCYQWLSGKFSSTTWHCIMICPWWQLRRLYWTIRSTVPVDYQHGIVLLMTLWLLLVCSLWFGIGCKVSQTVMKGFGQWVTWRSEYRCFWVIDQESKMSFYVILFKNCQDVGFCQDVAATLTPHFGQNVM